MSLLRLVPPEERRREDVLVRCKRCGLFARATPGAGAVFVFEVDHECPRAPFDFDRWFDNHAGKVILATLALAALVSYALKAVPR